MASTAIYNTKSTTLAANGAGDGVASGLGGMACEVDVFVQDSPTWGSGTLALQVSPDNGTTWLSLGGSGTVSWTSGGGRLTSSGPVKVIGATQIRVNLTGATSPSITPQLVVRKLEARNLFQTVFSADANSSSFNEQTLPDAVGVFIYGTFGSGTVKFQVSPDQGTTWYTVHSKTANDYTRVDNVREQTFRFILSGSTSPALTCYVA